MVDAIADDGVLAVDARRHEDVRRGRGSLFFDPRSGLASPNPGNPWAHVDSLERSGGDRFLVLERAGRTHRDERQLVQPR